MDGLEGLGLKVSGFANGTDFLSDRHRDPVDLILCDVLMPGIDGFAVLDHLRASGDKTPILLMSASLHTDLAKDCVARGALGFLPKPFSIEDLVAYIESLPRRDHAGPDSSL